MNALLSYLDSVVTGWTAAACVGATGWAFVARRLKRSDAVPAAYPPPPPPSVRRIPSLPPVPPSEAHWLSAWPVSGAHLIDFDAVHGLLSEPLEQQQYDRMFHEILAMEGLS